MSTPPAQPPDEPDKPDQPDQARERLKREWLAGAIVATVVVVLVAELIGLIDPVSGLVSGPIVSLLCVFLGSILIIFERTRRFALGFLIASAALIFVSAGVCLTSLQSVING